MLGKKFIFLLLINSLHIVSPLTNENVNCDVPGLCSVSKYCEYKIFLIGHYYLLFQYLG